jgi:hypothetical protein
VMYRVFQFQGAKSHVMPHNGEVYEAVVHDLESRDCPLIDSSPTTETILDVAGMVLANRPWTDIVIPGLVVGIACENVGYFMSYCASLKDRGGYFKIHSWKHCVCLSPADFFTFLGRLETEVPNAEKTDREFYEAWKARHGRKAGKDNVEY